MKKYTYVNSFHKTTAKSIYSQQDFAEIDYQLYNDAHFDKTNKIYRAMQIVERKLCGMKDCKCGAFNKQL